MPIVSILLLSQVGRLLETLAAVVEATKAQVEKRAALTFEEHQAELAEAEEVRELMGRALCHEVGLQEAAAAAPSVTDQRGDTAM